MVDCLILASLSDYFSAQAILEWVVKNATDPTWAYGMVFLLMVIESSFIPFPSEVIVPPVAYLSYGQSNLSVVLVVLVATSGAIVGALINYYLSAWVGRPIVYAFADSRLGHACLINREKVDKAEAYFDRHGAISTFIGRLIPAVRQLISIPAGLSRMNIWKFIIFTGLGAAVWNAILGGLGYWLGSFVPQTMLFETVEKYNTYLSYGGIAILVICIGVIAYNAFKPRKEPKNKD